MSISGTNEATQSVPFGTPVDTGNANAAGSAATAARSDHVHKGVVANEAWEDWTPTLNNMTKGDGTVLAKYARVGRTIFWRFRFVLGPGSAMSSSPSITPPVPMAEYTDSREPIGQCEIADTGTANIRGGVWEVGGNLGFFVSSAAGTYLTVSGITSAIPMTWVATDILAASGFYEAAS